MMVKTNVLLDNSFNHHTRKLALEKHDEEKDTSKGSRDSSSFSTILINLNVPLKDIMRSTSLRP